MYTVSNQEHIFQLFSPGMTSAMVTDVLTLRLRHVSLRSASRRGEKPQLIKNKQTANWRKTHTADTIKEGEMPCCHSEALRITEEEKETSMTQGK